VQITSTMKQPANLISKEFVKVLPTLNYQKVLREKLEDLKLEDSDDSFYICNVGDIVQKHLNWLQCFPRIKPHYAIKCNPDSMMLRSLIAMDTGFDCASKSEIRQMLDLGVEPDRIIFANPCKQTSHIRYARDNNISLLVFDNKDELEKTKKVFPNAQLVLRIQTDDSAATCQLSMKYGASINSCEGLLLTAMEMGLNVVGISFHVGSGCSDSAAYVEAIRNSRKLFDYATEIGFNFTLLDIGGGFPGTKDADLSFDDISDAVNMELSNSFPLKKFGNVKIIAEPGRYYAASAFTLVTNIIARKKAETADECDKRNGNDNSCTNTAMMYYVNDGLYDSFNCIFYDHANPKPSLMLLSDKSSVNGKCYPSSIWGPTCDGLDKINECLYLPSLNIGDWLVWENMGAYTVAAGSPFNGFKTKSIYYFISEYDLSLFREHVNMSTFVSLGLNFKNCEQEARTGITELNTHMMKQSENISFFKKCVESTIASAEEVNKSGFPIAASV